MKRVILKLPGILIITVGFLTACSDSSEEVDPCQNGPVLNLDNVKVSLEGQSNGEIVVSASGGQAPYMFSIDGTDFQSSGTFSNLEGDDYTVTVADANDCTNTLLATVREVPEVSYADQIRPIIDANCQVSGCHGDNPAIPTYETYADVQARAGAIKTRTSNGTMPPTGPLPNDQVQLIADWVDQGAPNN